MGKVNRKSFFRIAIGTVVSGGFIKAMSIISGVLVARELGASGKGVFSFGVAVFGLLNPLLSFGVGIATVYFVASGKFKTKEVFFTIVLLSLAIGVVVCGVFWCLVAGNLLGETGEKLTPVLVLPLLLASPAFALNALSRRLLHGENEYSWFNSINVFCTFLESALLITFVVFLNWGIFSGFIIVGVRHVIQSFIQTSVIFSRYGCSLKINFEFMSSVFRYGVKAWPENIVNRANARIDQLIIGMFVGSSELGNYSVAVSIADLTNIVRVSVGNPILTRLASETNTMRKLDLAGKASRFLLVVVFFQVIALGVIGWFAIPVIYTSEYLPARWILLFYLPGAMFLVPRSVIAKLFQAINRVVINTQTQVLAFIVSPIIYMLLIPVGHVYGIAIGSTCVYFLTTVFSFAFMKRMFPQVRLLDFLFASPTEFWGFVKSKMTRSSNE